MVIWALERLRSKSHSVQEARCLNRPILSLKSWSLESQWSSVSIGSQRSWILQAEEGGSTPHNRQTNHWWISEARGRNRRHKKQEPDLRQLKVCLLAHTARGSRKKLRGRLRRMGVRWLWPFIGYGEELGEKAILQPSWSMGVCNLSFLKLFDGGKTDRLET